MLRFWLWNIIRILFKTWRKFYVTIKKLQRTLNTILDEQLFLNYNIKNSLKY